MALRTIVEEGDSVLQKNCRPVTKFDRRLHMLLDDMTDTLIEASGAGLAAPQVGVLRRAIVVLRESDESFVELVNPEIILEEGEQEGAEGCLSVPGKWGLVKRPEHVIVRAQDRNGEPFEMEGTGLTARCLCHEIDHLNGHLYTEVMERFLSDEEAEAYFEQRAEEKERGKQE